MPFQIDTDPLTGAVHADAAYFLLMKVRERKIQRFSLLIFKIGVFFVKNRFAYRSQILSTSLYQFPYRIFNRPCSIYASISVEWVTNFKIF